MKVLKRAWHAIQALAFFALTLLSFYMMTVGVGLLAGEIRMLGFRALPALVNRLAGLALIPIFLSCLIFFGVFLYDSIKSVIIPRGG